MSINVLARKTRAIRGRQPGSTFPSSKGGKCCGPANGGRPIQQLSTRQLVKIKAAQAAIKTTGSGWGERWRSASENTEVKVIAELLCNNATYDYVGGVFTLPLDDCTTDKPTPSRNCSCNNCPKCSSRIFEQRCCNIYKFVGPLSNSENIVNKIVLRAGRTIVGKVPAAPDPTLTLITAADGVVTAHTLGSFAPYGMIPANWKNGENTLTGLRIGQGITSIGEGAFENCSGLLGDLAIPSSVLEIGNRAFDNCTSLNGTLTLDEGLLTIGVEAFQNLTSITGSLTIPNSVTSIGIRAFVNCTFNGTLTLNEGLLAIGIEAFDNCTSLTGSLTIPNSVTFIGAAAFRDFGTLVPFALGALTLGSGITDIPEDCFRFSAFTGSLIIPANVTSIGIRAFQDCTNFTALTLNEGLEEIGSDAFNNLASIFGSLTIPNSVTFIGVRAFRAWSSTIGTLTIGSGIIAILEGCFRYSTFTGNLIFPANVTSIGYRAFANCTGFTYLELGSTLAVIGDEAFAEGLEPLGLGVACDCYIPKTTIDAGGNVFLLTGLVEIHVLAADATWTIGFHFIGGKLMEVIKDL